MIFAVPNGAIIAMVASCAFTAQAGPLESPVFEPGICRWYLRLVVWHKLGDNVQDLTHLLEKSEDSHALRTILMRVIPWVYLAIVKLRIAVRSFGLPGRRYRLVCVRLLGGDNIGPNLLWIGQVGHHTDDGAVYLGAVVDVPLGPWRRTKLCTLLGGARLGGVLASVKGVRDAGATAESVADGSSLKSLTAAGAVGSIPLCTAPAGGDGSSSSLTTNTRSVFASGVAPLLTGSASHWVCAQDGHAAAEAVAHNPVLARSVDSGSTVAASYSDFPVLMGKGFGS